MPISLAKEKQTEAISSLQRYFSENMDEPLGNLAAQALLDFLLVEIAPLVYNKAVADAQAKLLARVSELDIEVHQEEFQYWSSAKRKTK